MSAAITSKTGRPLPTPPRRTGRATWLGDLLSSVWFGVSLLVVLFLYCSIGSAVPQLRQQPYFEMTEFEWFHWWPFDLLIVLICLNITVVTIRRIPLRLVNAGVWMIHVGIITLAIGSVIYFTRKIEGDVPVFRRAVAMTAPDGTRAELVALPGASTSFQTSQGVYQVQVQSTHSDYTLLTGADKGRKTHAVTLMITPPAGEPFARQLLSGYPEYTEDVIPGKGRAIKTLGRALVDESFHAELEYVPATDFGVMSTWALYVREVGQAQWVERPIRGLPRYNDRIASRDWVVCDEKVALRPIDLEVPPSDQADALSEASVHVTGFLRYAELRQHWRDGGAQLNPRLELAVSGPHAQTQTFDLFAGSDSHNKLGGAIEFRWLPDASAVERLPTATESQLVFHVADPHAELTVPVTEQNVGQEAAWTDVDGTPFSFRITGVMDNFARPAGGTVSIALVELRDGEKTWTRIVADDPAATRDMPTMDGAAHAAGGGFLEPDPRIEIRYEPAGAPMIFAALPDGRLFVSAVVPGAEPLQRFVSIGEPISFDGAIQVTPTSLMLHAQADIKPYVVPLSARQRDARETFSMIRLEVTSGGTTQTQWVRYNEWALPGPEFGVGRLPYTPVVFRLRDGRQVEVLFSREREELPSPVILEEFELISHDGGFTGSNLTVRNWESHVRFLDGDQWSDEIKSLSVNDPTEDRGFWFFQSAWDAPPRNNLSGGMNYTILGVGNREGVHIQLLGCCVSVAGMIFAFYVKPIIKRRRREQAAARVGAADEMPVGNVEPEGVGEPVGVG
ncbi:MAG: hypothetical protein C4547_14575 [Phycisphaerales bacterium]|nr:MAG: hypothetical protein C4547_14575 [Phycisphaerales bacterium]